jgi:hypothetical protein
VTRDDTAIAPPRETKIVAQAQDYQPEKTAARWIIAGVFDKRDKSVVITINGDKAIAAKFPPYTPRLDAEARYQGKDVRALCAFSNYIIEGDSVRAKIAEAIVNKSAGIGNNACKVSVDGWHAATLYF